MTPDGLREFCLHLPGTKETFPFEPGVSVFKHAANSKVFAITDLDGIPLDVTLKADPDRAEMLRGTYESIVPGYHNNKRHWITATFGGDAPDDLIQSLIEDSYDLIKPRTRGRR
jgi:predicted DNA-binding protein (MmcQ/YjbR family)